MKKFMTVLLVVSVMFTFSFSSAFAANTAAQYNVNVTAAEAEALDTLEVTYNQVVKNLTDAELGTTGWTIDKAQWALAAPYAYQAAKDAIKGVTVTLKGKDATWYDKTHDDLMTEYYAVLSGYDYLGLKADVTAAANEAGLFEAAKVQFGIDKAEFIANVAKVDTSIWSDVEGSVVGTVDGVDYKTSKSYVEAVLAKVVADIEKEVLTAAEDTSGAVAGVYGTVKGLFDAEITTTPNADGTYTYTFKNTTGLTTAAQEEANAAQNAASAAAQKATLAGDIAAYKATDEYLKATDKTPITKAQVEKFVEAYNVAHTWLIENGFGYSTATLTYDSALVSNVEQAAKAIAGAEAVKAKVTEEGKAAYDAEKVDAALEKLLEDAYKKTVTYTYAVTDFDGAKLTYLSTYAKETFKKAVTDLVKAEELKYNGVEYYAPEFAKVEEAVAAFVAAVDAAEIQKAMDDAKTAFNAAVAPTKIKIASKVEEEIKLAASFSTEKGKLVQYVNYLNSINTGDNALQFAFDVADDDALAKWYAEQGARTDAEIKALYEDACAALAGAPSKAANEAATKAVETQIDALGAAPTKEAVKAAYDANEALAVKVDSAHQTVLDAAVKAVAVADAEAIAELAKAVKDLDATKVTVADKAALKAYADAVKAYNEDKMYDAAGVTDITPVVDTETLLNTIKAAEKKAVEDAVAALPAAGKVTVADKAAIEAARAAYEAYVAEYTVYGTYDAAAALAAVMPTLEAAENALAILTAFDDADAKAYVQDLKVVARSVKTAKGNVKVTIKADVEKLTENGYTVEYKFYRSTKSNAKFGTAKKVSEENTYTNTAGKKGVKYFYKAKLVVKNAEGEVVATTPLTQCLYASRTWTK